MKRNLLNCFAVLLTFASVTQAQTSAYVWDDSEGGLVDQQTGLVWGFGPTNLLDWSYTYQYAVDHAGEDYAATPWGYGYTDWRVPSKAELLDAINKDVYLELYFYAGQFGLHQPYPNGYWAADAPFKKKGLWLGYGVNLETGAVTTRGVGSIGRAIVVRQASED